MGGQGRGWGAESGDREVWGWGPLRASICRAAGQVVARGHVFRCAHAIVHDRRSARVELRSPIARVGLLGPVS